jgi:IS5 family transposase
MKQISFSQVEFERKKRLTKREVFLAELEQLIPWSALLAVVLPYYPKSSRGRPPVGLARMLRVYCVQVCYNLSDEGVEDAITNSQALRPLSALTSPHRPRSRTKPRPVTPRCTRPRKETSGTSA